MPDATGAGLMASLRGLLCTGLALAENRLALLSNELEEQKLRLVYGLVMVVAGLFVLGVGLVLMCGFVLQLLWEGYRLPALAVLTLAFLGAGAWLLARARRHLHTIGGPIAASVDELRADRVAVESGMKGGPSA
jgi:uncharacterized membrane protein YqjE